MITILITLQKKCQKKLLTLYIRKLLKCLDQEIFIKSFYGNITICLWHTAMGGVNILNIHFFFLQNPAAKKQALKLAQEYLDVRPTKTKGYRQSTPLAQVRIDRQLHTI